MTLKHSYNSTIAEDPASGTPGGLVGPNEWNADHAVSGTSLQTLFNNAGSLTGMSGTSWDNTNLALTITGATVTTSNPILNLSQTWNAGGVTFTGLKLNVTNTASHAGSALFDFQVGGVSQFDYYPNASTLELGNSTTATAFHVYNTVDTLGGPTNYERGVFDWTTTPNTLTIGTQAGGTGTARDIQINPASGTLKIQSTNQTNVVISSPNLGGGFSVNDALSNVRVKFGYNIVTNATGQIAVDSAGLVGFNSTTNLAGGSVDTAIARAAAGILEINNGTNGVLTGSYIHWGGQARVTSDVTNATASLADATGLSVSVAAGRTYSFEVQISFTDAAAGGIQVAMVAANSLTATNIIYDGWIIDSGANGIKGNAQATALSGVVASATTTGTAGHVTIYGVITVNAAGTLKVQFAQNTSNGTATTVKRGSYMLVHDMP